MSDLNKLMQDITNTEITKQELQRQLETLSKEYEMECKELQSLNDKNLQYKTELDKQESQKRLKDERDKKAEAKANLNAFVSELGGII